MLPSPSQSLAVVQASPAAVALHDRAAWLDLFTADAIIEDPVGSAAHSTPDARGRFWDTFIGPNVIRFEVHHDVVSGPRVARDLTIHTELPSWARVAVPAYLLYRVTDSEAPRIAHLQAHWELRRMIPPVLRQGSAGVGSSAGLAWRLLRNQGVGGALAYGQGLLRGVFDGGHRVATSLDATLQEGNAEAVRTALGKALLSDGQGPIQVEELVALGLRLSDPLSTGWRTVTRARTPGRRGLAVLDFAPGTTTLARVEILLGPCP